MSKDREALLLHVGICSGCTELAQKVIDESGTFERERANAIKLAVESGERLRAEIEELRAAGHHKAADGCAQIATALLNAEILVEMEEEPPENAACCGALMIDGACTKCDASAAQRLRDRELGEAIAKSYGGSDAVS